MNVRCGRCFDEGRRSLVYGGESRSRTLMPTEHFWDEDGHEHWHDPNWSASVFTCSNGHRWQQRWQSQCPMAVLTGCQPIRTPEEEWLDDLSASDA